MKDPAFLFYSSDFLTGTMFMCNEQVGKYIRLLCCQHQKGHLTEKDMLKICETYDENIFDKFIKDENGFFYNLRLENETIKRKNYSESRRNNRKGKKDMNNICESYVKHMENENENENINKDKIVKENLLTKTSEINQNLSIKKSKVSIEKMSLEIIKQNCSKIKEDIIKNAGEHEKNELLALLRDFYNYWTEPLTNDINSQRWQKEKAFDTLRRWNTWLQNNNKFKQPKN
jgi:hypothetical protein